MLELLILLGGLTALVILGLLLKVTLAIVFSVLVLPLKILGFVLGGLFRLLFLPFQIVGGLLLGLLFLPLLLIALPLLVGIGVPLLVGGVLLFGLWIVVGAVCLMGTAMFGWC